MRDPGVQCSVTAQPHSDTPPPSAAPASDVPPGPVEPTRSTTGDEDVPDHIRQLRAVRAVLWALVGVITVAWLFMGGGLESLTSLTGSAGPPWDTQ